jgi:hypothetical protein
VNLQRIRVKFYVNNPIEVDITLFIPIFHRWIQEHTVPGLLIDVVDYKHVRQGPGIILIGHEGDYGIDLEGGQLGLVYTRKRDLTGTVAERLQTTLYPALLAGRTLEETPELNGRFTFHTNQLELSFPDRLHAPNTPETLAALRPDILALAADLYPGADVALTPGDDEKRPFTVHLLTANQSPTFTELLDRIAAPLPV